MAEHFYPVATPERLELLGRESSSSTESDALLDIEAARRFLASRGWIIASVAVLCLVLAGIALAFLPKTYSAAAILIIDPRTQKVTPSDAVLSGIGSDAVAVESQVEVLESSTIAKRVIARLGLDQAGELVEPTFTAKTVEHVRSIFGLAAPLVSPEERAERIVSQFLARLNVRRRGLTYVLEVVYHSGSPQTAAQVSNAIAQAYLGDQLNIKLNAAKDAAGLLNERLTELKTKATDAEVAVAKFKKQNDIVDLGSNITLLDREITEQSQQLTQARARRADAAARLEQAIRAMASTAGGGTLAESLQSNVVTNLRNQYAQISTQLADLRNNLGPRHPAVSTAEVQLHSVARQIRIEIERVASAIRNENEAAATREASISAGLERLKRLAEQRGQAHVRLSELQREAQASKIILEQYLLRQKETTEQQGLQSVDARIITPAPLPLQASSPKPILIFAVTLIGGLIIGLALALLIDRMQPGLRSVNAVEKGLGAPLIGLLPRVTPDRARFPLRHYIGDSKEHHAFHDGIRMLTLSLGACADATKPGTLLITSALTAEGRSTVAEHLADVFARQDWKVLLVDLDLSNADLTRARNVTNKLGLLDAVRNSSDPLGLIDRSGSNTFSFLPAGAIQDASRRSELMLSPQFGRAIASLRTYFDIIIFDSVPLLQGVDSRLLLQHADRTVLITEWGRTNRGNVRTALNYILNSPSTLSGVVFNKVDVKALNGYA